MASNDDEPVCCTRAITGSQYPIHQPIYICYTCQLFEPERGRIAEDEDDDGSSNGSNGGGDDGDDGGDSNSIINEPLPACICESCAFECHADHECYYVGVGLCTCDCPLLVCTKNNNNSTNSEGDDDDGDGDILPVRHKCRLAEHSAKQAERIGFADIRPLNCPIPLKVPSTTTLTSEEVPKDEDDVNENDDEKKEDGNNASEKEKGDNDLSQLVSSGLCMECHSTMGGYNYASFTLPALVENGGKLCQNLIRQAEVLTDHSRDTFWIPEDAINKDDTNNDDNDDDEWCDLEMFAKQIYQQHIQSYSLQQTPSNNEEQKDTEEDINNASKSAAAAAVSLASSSSGGAEWWVQVKPAGQSRAPVDLHYDKDEVLAETFGLGSFPTLSTVTYLTGEEDNSPTVVFPHSYHDEEDHGIGSMLLSCARRAKHIVFDGRLLHGAPAHPSLRKRSNITNVQNNVESNNTEDAVEEEESSLRVTFLVNIWKSGRPAGVHILPQSIRSKFQSDANTETIPFQDGMPLEFEQRHTSKLSVNSSTKTFVDDDGSGKKISAEKERIVLPFVSAGATWIGGDETDVDVEASGEDESERDKGDKEDGITTASGEGEDDEEEGDEDNDDGDYGVDEVEEGGVDDEEEEEDSDLFLVLPPFATPEYLDDKADTFVLSFEGDSEVRLVRGVALDKMTQPNCRWKNLVAKNRLKKSQTAAAEFLSHLHEHVPPFISSIVAELKNQCNIDVSNLQADHVCYRTDSLEQYTSLVEALQSPDVDDFTLLVESEIGGRPIATFKLAEPIEILSADNCCHSIDVVEIPSPKEGSPYEAGLEHAEFVIGGSTDCKSPMNDDTHGEVLNSWMERYPEVSWNAKALHKQCNPDISTKLEIHDYGKVSIKFHLMPLEEVIEFEVRGS